MAEVSLDAVTEAVARAQGYAAEAFGWQNTRAEDVARGASWWLVTLTAPGVPITETPTLVVEDDGPIHAEPVPIEPWFDDVEPVDVIPE